MPITATPTVLADITVPIRRTIWGSHSEGTEKTKTATAKVTYQVDWDDRWEFIRQINGIFDGDTSIRLPMQYPDLPGILVDSTSDVKGIGRGTGCDSPYKYALVPVTFKTPDYETSGDNAYLKIDRNLAGQYVTCPNGVYSFADGAKNNDSGIGEFVPCVGYNITQYKIRAFDDAAFKSYVGKINNSPIFGCATGTLRFEGLQSTSTVDIGNIVLTDATWAFTWRPYHWNWAKHPMTGAWELIDPIIHFSASLEDLFA